MKIPPNGYGRWRERIGKLFKPRGAKVQARLALEFGKICRKIQETNRYIILETFPQNFTIRYVSADDKWTIQTKIVFRNKYFWNSTEVRGKKPPALRDLEPIKFDLHGSEYAEIRYRFYGSECVGHILRSL